MGTEAMPFLLFPFPRGNITGDDAMNSGMQWVDSSTLQLRFSSPLLIEVDGDRSDLASTLCEVVDVQDQGSGQFTILHVPAGTLPCACDRAMATSYLQQQVDSCCTKA